MTTTPVDPTDKTLAAIPGGEALEATHLATGEATPFMDAEPSDLVRGALVGRYVVLSKLGAGGMGVVFAAYDPELDRKVALKLLHPRLAADADPFTTREARTRLVREAQALAKLNHPHIVAIHDVGEHERAVWLAMEYVDGETLSAWLKHRRRTWREVLDLLTAARGLSAAHDVGLVHRDIKPDNIMVGNDGRVRVMDLGLARAIGDGLVASVASDASTAAGRDLAALAARVTQAGAVMGTPAYMSPEQFRSEPVDARADVFSFCVMLWEALMGTRPFAGSTLIELATNVLSGRTLPVPRDAHSRRVPNWLRRVCLQGLAVDPGRRFPSMQALLDSLSRGRTRARTYKWLGGVVVVAALVAAGLHATTADADACDGGPARFAAVWGPDRATALEMAFIATGRPHAQMTATGVREGLDRYAATWVAMYRSACATSRRGEQSAAMLDRRMACLDRRRGEVAAQVELFAAADGAVVDGAIAALQGLTPVATCGDPVALAAKVPPPDDATVRAEVDEIQRELDGLEASVRAGRARAALPALELLSVRAEAVAYPPVLAEVALLRGTVLAQLSRGGDAENWLFRALWLAEAEHHDEVVATAWLELVRLIELQGERDASLRWADGADAAVTRLGDPPRLRARLLNNRGVVAIAARQLPAALDLFSQALRMRNEQLPDDEVEIANTLNNLGNVLMLMQRRSEARATHERALALRERLLGPSHPDVAGSCLNLGGLMDDDDEKLRWYARASAIWRASAGPDDPRLATVMVNTANIHVRRGATAEARRLLEAASLLLTRTVPPDNPNLLAVRANLAALEALAGHYTAAAAMMEEELARREQNDGPDDPRSVDLRANLAAVRISQGDYDAAEPLLRHNLYVLAAVHGEGSVMSLGTQITLAEVLLRRDRLPEAAHMLRAARARCDGLVDGADHCPRIAVYEANLALLQGDPEAALLALRRVELDPDGDPISRAEQDFLRGQILGDSGADRAEGRRIVASALALLRTVPEYAPARIAEMQAWLAHDALRRE